MTVESGDEEVNQEVQRGKEKSTGERNLYSPGLSNDQPTLKHCGSVNGNSRYSHKDLYSIDTILTQFFQGLLTPSDLASH